jgi:putative NADH-flavin reductase
MKIALFGATGGTGIEFLTQSKDYNYDITAFVRSPEKLQGQFPDLKIVKASIDDYMVLKDTVKDFDIIISLVGLAGIMQARKPNALYERTAKNLIRLAQENHIKRLIVVTSGGVVEAPNEPWFFKHLLKPIFLNKMYDDMKVMEDLVLKSNLDYTIVRPPYLTKGKLTKQYRTIIDKWFEDDKDLSRADLAHYLLNCLTDTAISKRIVGISY